MLRGQEEKEKAEEAAAFADNVLIALDSGKLALPLLRDDATVIVFLGANQSEVSYQKHSDGLRANAIRHLYNVKLFTVGSQFANADFPLHVQAHFDRAHTWTGEAHRHGTRKGMLGLNTTIAPEVIMLDYFFLVRGYFDHRKGECNGYSDEWFSGIAPGVIRSGPTKVMLLPNDQWGMIQALRKASEERNNDMAVYSTELTLSEVEKYHPLWYATDVAMNNPGWLPTLARMWRNRSNLNSLEEYLHQTHPIIMVYDAKVFGDRKEALQYLESLKLPRVIAVEKAVSCAPSLCHSFWELQY